MTVVQPLSLAVPSSSQPASLSACYVNGVGLQLTLNGQTGLFYTIQVSTNLMQWSPVNTNYATVPERYVTLPVGSTGSFYQAVVP